MMKLETLKTPKSLVRVRGDDSQNSQNWVDDSEYQNSRNSGLAAMTLESGLVTETLETPKLLVWVGDDDSNSRNRVGDDDSRNSQTLGPSW